MSRYVLELNSDIIKSIVAFGMMGETGVSTVFKIDELEELTPDYINEHFGELQETAYHRGLEEGNDIGYKNGVKDGQNDAWEAAKKIALMDTETSENVTGYFGLFRIMENLTPMQALEKLKAYEKQKAADDIKVGDEVRDDDGDTYIITCINDDGTFDALYPDGTAFSRADMSIIYELTGRHFDIDKILEAMKA